MPTTTSVISDPWSPLRGVTPARIGLGRSGGSLPTREWLEFKSAHAAARDAVHNYFDAEALANEIRALGSEVLLVESQAKDRTTFLQRPDLGRRIDDKSRHALQISPQRATALDLAIIVSDGLSALAVERHARPLLAGLLARLAADAWNVAPVVIARFGRVALQDEIGQALGARLALMLIGERPGLGSADSLGAYLVYAPRLGNTDANRNCVSNIRSEGLTYEAAADTIHYLLTEARRRGLSGVQLKDQRTLARPEERRPPKRAIGDTARTVAEEGESE